MRNRPLPVPAGRRAGQYRHFIILPLLLLVCAAFFAWAAYTFLPAAMDASQRQIVNDDYNTLTPPLAAGDEILQDLVVKGRIYGVILDIATFERVPHGTLHLRLHDENGELAAACDTDMTLLLDNTFHRFLFDAPVDGGAGTVYQLSVMASPESEQDLVALHKSSGPAQDFLVSSPGQPHYKLADFSLRESGQPAEGTLALQYVTRYAGGAPARLFAGLAALFTALVLLAYCLLFAFRFSLSWLAATVCLVLGFAFILLLPAHALLPKEPLSDVYHYSSVLLGQGGQDNLAGLLSSKATVGAQGALFAREQDAFLWRETPLDVFAWQDQLEGVHTAGNEPVLVEAQRAGIPPVFTAPMVLVFTLCRLLGVPGLAMLLAARVLNLLLYCALALLALRQMPLAKPLLAAVFLLPSSLQAAVAFHGGGLALALALLCCASLLRRWERHPHWEARKLPAFLGLAAGVAGLGFAAAHAPLVAQTNRLDGLLATLLGGAWGNAPVATGLNWLLLLCLALLVWALSLPSQETQRPFAPKTRLAAGIGAGLLAFSAAVFVLALPVVADAMALLPVFFLLLAALRGRNLAFIRDISRPLLLVFVLAAVLLQTDFFILIAKVSTN